MKKKFILFKDLHLSSELRRDLNRNILGVSLGIAFFQAIGGAPFAGFIKELGVSDFLYGILMSLPVMGGLFQVIGAFILEKTKTRKKIFLLSGILQRTPFLLVALLPVLMPASLKNLMLVLIGISLMLSSLGGAFNGVSFFSWMGALVPANIRGRFFSQRQMVYTFTGFVAGLLVSSFLDRVKGFTGFAYVFTFLVVLALLDIACFIKMYDPPMESSEDKLSLVEVWKGALQHKNFRRYLLFWGVWTFGISVSGPFFNAYMIEYLHMGYSTIFIYTSILFTLATMLFVRVWGALSDRFGNKPVMQICGFGVVILPMLWLFATPENYQVILLVNLFAGTFWCGTELTSNNMMLGLSPDKNRSFYIANFALVTALSGNVVGYAAGGYFMDVSRDFISSLNLSFLGYSISNYHVLFMFSGILRFLAIAFFLPFVHEDKTHPAGAVIRYSMGRLVEMSKLRR